MFLESWKIALLIISTFLLGFYFCYFSYLVYRFFKERYRQKRILLHRIDSLEDRVRSCETYSTLYYDIFDNLTRLNNEVFKDEKE